MTHDHALYIRLTDDGQFIRKWDRKPFDGGKAYYAEGVQPQHDLDRLRTEISTISAQLAAVTADRDRLLLITDEKVERVARALCRQKIEFNRRFDSPDLIRDEDFMQRAVNHAWRDYVDDALAALSASQADGGKHG